MVKFNFKVNDEMAQSLLDAELAQCEFGLEMTQYKVRDGLVGGKL